MASNLETHVYSWTNRGTTAAPIVASRPRCRIRAEIDSLPHSAVLARRGSIDVVIAPGRDIPELLHEIGRQRETAFREVGEGTGDSLDLDLFDLSYRHLIAWDREHEVVAGAYRMRSTLDAIGWIDPEALYSHTLFEFGESWLRALGPAVELGRSFVAPEYQRTSPVLLMLWKSIGRWLAQHPQFRTLFGPVSISASYPDLVRRHMVSRLSSRFGDAALAATVRARLPFLVPRPGEGTDRLDDSAAIDGLSNDIARIDPQGRELPILIREYLKLGGRFAGFNLDRAFADVVDGLVVVRLDRTPARLLQFYLGREGVESFMQGRPV